MADFNEIEDVAAGMAAYQTGNSLFRRYGTLNVLFWVALILVVLGCGLLWFGNHVTAKGEAFTWSKVKPDDKLYVQHLLLTDTALAETFFYRLVRPMTASDIEAMHIPEWKKKKMITQLDTTKSKEARMVTSDLVALQSKMFKHNSAYIGNFIKKDSVYCFLKDGMHEDLKWYAISPNKKVVVSKYVVNLPPNYVFVDNYYYIQPENLRLKEDSTFLKK